mmetsp:Transcript_90229/g.263900  ORF Transcript_90229/g.263900 Transcript_90229/m.263900 type:complete len:501 (+) Transcript_90229:901-2403(+)
MAQLRDDANLRQEIRRRVPSAIAAAAAGSWVECLHHDLPSPQPSSVHHGELPAADALAELDVREAEDLLLVQSSAQRKQGRGVRERRGWLPGAGVPERGVRGRAGGAWTRRSGRGRGSHERRHCGSSPSGPLPGLPVLCAGRARRGRLRRARRQEAARLRVEQRDGGLLRRQLHQPHPRRLPGDEAGAGLRHAGQAAPAPREARGAEGGAGGGGGSQCRQRSPQARLQRVGAQEVLLGQGVQRRRLPLAPLRRAAPVVRHAEVEVRSALLRGSKGQGAGGLLQALLQELHGAVGLPLLAEQELAHVQKRRRRVLVHSQSPLEEALCGVEVALRTPEAGGAHEHVCAGAGACEAAGELQVPLRRGVVPAEGLREAQGGLEDLVPAPLRGAAVSGVLQGCCMEGLHGLSEGVHGELGEALQGPRQLQRPAPGAAAELLDAAAALQRLAVLLVEHVRQGQRHGRVHVAGGVALLQHLEQALPALGAAAGPDEGLAKPVERACT